jgi:hypothetical protein
MAPVGASVLLFGTGMVVPWGLLQLGWAQLAHGQRRTGSRDRGAADLERCALLDQPPPAAHAAPGALHGDHHRSV